MYKLLVFSWNTESISLAESLNPEVVDENRQSYSSVIPGITSWRCNSFLPDFFPDLEKKIKEEDVGVVVIGFQEDRFPGSYFHSHFLPEQMEKLGFSAVKRTKLMGFGVTSYKGLFRGDIFERGIRVSVYAKRGLVPLIEKEEAEMRKAVGNQGQDEYLCSSCLTRSKGATVSYLKLPGVSRLAFVCCHLPFNSKSLIVGKLQGNTMIRQTELNSVNACFNNIVQDLVLLQDQVPSHVIFFGDFNYRLQSPGSASEVAAGFQSGNPEFLKEMYTKFDELREQTLRKNIYEFHEGVEGRGPCFPPTCKLKKGRKEDELVFKTGRLDQRVPSWCDRILYKTFSGTGTLACTSYERFDKGQTMTNSDHAAVLAVFKISS